MQCTCTHLRQDRVPQGPTNHYKQTKITRYHPGGLPKLDVTPSLAELATHPDFDKSISTDTARPSLTVKSPWGQTLHKVVNHSRWLNLTVDMAHADAHNTDTPIPFRESTRLIAASQYSDTWVNRNRPWRPS